MSKVLRTLSVAVLILVWVFAALIAAAWVAGHPLIDGLSGSPR